MTPLHDEPLQKAKTPYSEPLYDPSGIALMIGVERTERRRKTNATKSRTAKGVAGLNMVNDV